MTAPAYTSGYTDFNRDIAEQIGEAHHLRYIKTPSGRKLYLIGSVENDADEIAEIKCITAACTRVDIETVRAPEHARRVRDALAALRSRSMEAADAGLTVTFTIDATVPNCDGEGQMQELEVVIERRERF